MRPHAKDFDGSRLGQDLINNSVLNIHPAGIGAFEIANKLLKWRWHLIRISAEDFENRYSLGFEVGRSELLGILLSLLCIADFPGHQRSSDAHFPTGVAMPFRMDSRIPGIDSRNRVS